MTTRGMRAIFLLSSQAEKSNRSIGSLSLMDDKGRRIVSCINLFILWINSNGAKDTENRGKGKESKEKKANGYVEFVIFLTFNKPFIIFPRKLFNGGEREQRI